MAAFRRYKAEKKNNPAIVNPSSEQPHASNSLSTHEGRSLTNTSDGWATRQQQVSRHSNAWISKAQHEESNQLSDIATSVKPSLTNLSESQSTKFDFGVFVPPKSTLNSSAIAVSKPSTEINGYNSFAKDCTNTQRKGSLSPTYTFSSPILLNPAVRPTINEMASCRSQYSFSQPRPLHKKPISNDSSFLSVLISQKKIARNCQPSTHGESNLL